LNIAVFVSGRGSNFKAILDSSELKDLVKIKAVFSDKLDCPAFQIAEEHSIPAFSLGNKDGCLPYSELSRKLKETGTDLIVLAGFLKLIPAEIVDEFESRIINIHPALLPSFGGAGMYGMHVHTAVFNSSAKVSGATVHFVDREFDTGKIIAQKCVDISDVTSPQEIAERVLEAEHTLLPYVIRKIAENKIKRVAERVIISE
jgi:phosphoribosylglycinamide formyltransferase 1